MKSLFIRVNPIFQKEKEKRESKPPLIRRKVGKSQRQIHPWSQKTISFSLVKYFTNNVIKKKKKKTLLTIIIIIIKFVNTRDPSDPYLVFSHPIKKMKA